MIFQGGPDPLSPLWIRPCIAIDALSMNISSQPPQTQNMTSADIFVQPISEHIPTPSLVSLSDLSIIFIGWVFSLESHLTGEPCDYFLLSIIDARNYVLACIFCIVWCQQISIWNKQIESSICLIKQVGKFFKIWWSEKEQGTHKIKILNWGTGEHRDSWLHRNTRTGAHWEGLNIFSYAKILWAQTLAIICIWWNYFDMISNPSPILLLRLIKPYNYSSIVN